MATAKISVKQISDNDLVNKIEEAAGNALSEQSWFSRRKNTLTAIAQFILQAANVALFALGDVHIGVTIAVAIILSLAEIVVHAATKAPVTPASAGKIAQAAQKVKPTVSEIQIPSKYIDEAVKRVSAQASVGRHRLNEEVQAVGNSVDNYIRSIRGEE